ncbi:hypothetical protein JTB14_012692 [Gonioctena quinquepunctata]|nr:hypothetical protein JTB14_012692 [Gonioctena quinquepunctata]
MRKFITTKINNQQWRMTVPNLNTTIFRKSSSKEDDKSDKESKRSSGFYDFQDAQQEYDKSRSLPNSVYVETSSSGDDEEEFEDARTLSDKSSTRNKENSDTDMEVYQDVETCPTQVVSKNISQNNSQFEYDVPRISFKFFEKQKQDKKNDELYENEQANYEPVEVKKSEVKIVLSTPEEEETAIDAPESPPEADLPVCHPSERFVSQTEIFVRSLEEIAVDVLKSAGSDPSLVLREQSSDDGFYQVPRSLKKTHRISRSLSDFDEENMDNPANLPSSNHSSIEHISASQVIINNFDEESPTQALRLSARTNEEQAAAVEEILVADQT